MSNENKTEELLKIMNLIPFKIYLTDSWDYQYIGKQLVELNKKESITTYIFKWNDNGNSYYTLEMVNEKFDLLSLPKKLLKKTFGRLSEEEKLFLHLWHQTILLGEDE